MTENIFERIDRSTVPEPNTGCILWLGTLDKDGYGKTTYKNKFVRAHRLVYMLEYGEIPKGSLIQHKCDTPACCNINHLEIGTPLSNMQDKVSKGRLKNQFMSLTHCKRGHEFSGENLRMTMGTKRPKRSCRICTVERARKRYLAQKNAA